MSTTTLFTLCIIAFVATSVVVGQVQQPTDASRGSQSAGARVSKPVKCYQCNSNSLGQGDCKDSDADQLSKYIKPCPKLTEGTFKGQDANSCRKILQDVSDNKRGVAVVRECAYNGDAEVDGKRRTGNKGITLKLYQCFNDQNNDKPCNGSTTYKAMILAIIPLVFFLFLL